VDHYIVVNEGAGRYVIVAEGEPPLPATFDSWHKAQSVAHRLNARYRAGELRNQRP
jgi:hypothetical protein